MSGNFYENNGLNMDQGRIKTPAEYDENLKKWVIYTKQADDGEKMEYFGRTESDRPAANSVPIGAVYMAVDEGGKTWQSNGIDWVVF